MGEERGGMRDTEGRRFRVPTLSYKINESRVWNAKETILPCFYNLFSNIANNILLWFLLFLYGSSSVSSFLLNFINLRISLSLFCGQLNLINSIYPYERSHLKFFDILSVFFKLLILFISHSYLLWFLLSFYN